MSHPIFQRLNNINLDDFSIKKNDCWKAVDVPKGPPYDSIDPEIAQKLFIYNSAIQTQNAFLAGDPIEGDDFKNHNIIDLTPVTPYVMRNLILAQLNDRSTKQCGMFNGERVRTATFSQILLGFPLSLLARIIRVAYRTIFILVSVPVAAFQQRRYKTSYNIVQEDVLRIGREWVDLAVTLVSPIIALINTASPQAIPLDRMRNYYTNRGAEQIGRNNEFYAAKARYIQQEMALQASIQKARADSGIIN